ncbi:hypothetical protein SAMN04487792_1049 [Lactobacillus bombicola]|uniref:Helix-turn-helix domain-containing protein n=1 Tax=Lactobacillus bombicola TaxID=1505723 RepID=A0A1I1SPK0_9LACO|nr:hypothetical protein [Lactobacillus bombicola]SFD48415.1 hypothetical protein SAMN04487792_1049 [Lactobacillus bombicola]
MTLVILNGKQLREQLHISTTIFYRLRKAGMPYHQLPGGRAYYSLDEVEKWLTQAGYHQEKTWVK